MTDQENGRREAGVYVGPTADKPRYISTRIAAHLRYECLSLARRDLRLFKYQGAADFAADVTKVAAVYWSFITTGNAVGVEVIPHEESRPLPGPSLPVPVGEGK